MRNPFGHIPSVGAPLRVIVAYSTAVIECQCDAKTVIVLACKGRPASCPACGKVFAIADSGNLQIGEVVMPKAADLVPS